MKIQISLISETFLPRVEGFSSFRPSSCLLRSFLPFYLSSFFLSILPSYLPFYRPSFLSSSLLTFLPTFLPYFLHSSLPTYLPSFLFTFLLFLWFLEPQWIPIFHHLNQLSPAKWSCVSEKRMRESSMAAVGGKWLLSPWMFPQLKLPRAHGGKKSQKHSTQSGLSGGCERSRPAERRCCSPALLITPSGMRPRAAAPPLRGLAPH